MIKLMIVICDACKKESFSDGPKMPQGWISVRWVKGILEPLGAPTKPESGRYHLCSPACEKKMFPPEPNAYGGK